MSGGQSLEEVYRWPLSRLYAALSYLRKNPPTHQLVAAYLGYQPPKEASADPMVDFIEALSTHGLGHVDGYAERGN